MYNLFDLLMFILLCNPTNPIFREKSPGIVQVCMCDTELQHHGAPALLHNPKRVMRLVRRERQRGQSLHKTLLQQHLAEATLRFKKKGSPYNVLKDICTHAL